MGFKRSCGSTARIGNEHRRFDLHEALCIEIAANCADDFRALDKGILSLGIHNEIDITLTISCIDIGQPVEFFRQHLQAFREQNQLRRMHGNLTGFCAEYFAFNTDNVSDVKFFECRIWRLSNAVPGNINLHFSLQILNMAERSLAHDAFGHHPAGNAHRLPFQRLKIAANFLAVMCHIVFCQSKRIVSLRLQGRKLISAYPQYFIQLFAGKLFCFIVICSYFVRHSVLPFDNCFQLSFFSIFITLNLATPSGTSTEMMSPTFVPISALPIGD